MSRIGRIIALASSSFRSCWRSISRWSYSHVKVRQGGEKKRSKNTVGKHRGFALPSWYVQYLFIKTGMELKSTRKYSSTWWFTKAYMNNLKKKNEARREAWPNRSAKELLRHIDMKKKSMTWVVEVQRRFGSLLLSLEGRFAPLSQGVPLQIQSMGQWLPQCGVGSCNLQISLHRTVYGCVRLLVT